MRDLSLFDANKWSLIVKGFSLMKIFLRTTVQRGEQSCPASDSSPLIKWLPATLFNWKNLQLIKGSMTWVVHSVPQKCCWISGSLYPLVLQTIRVTSWQTYSRTPTLFHLYRFPSRPAKSNIAERGQHSCACQYNIETSEANRFRNWTCAQW